MFQQDVLTAADPGQHTGPGDDIVWHHPSRPIRITLQGGIGTTLAEKAVAASNAEIPSEVGGILFGRVETGGLDLEITLTSAVFVGGESRLFNSTANDAAALTHALGQNSDPGSKPVGYFRSDLRALSSLSAQDKEFTGNSLPISNSVSVLLRPLHSGVCMVGVFLWKNNRLERESMDFAMPLFTSESPSSPVPPPPISPETPVRKTEPTSAAIPPNQDGVSVSLRRDSATPATADGGKGTTNALLGFLIGATVCLCVLIVASLGFLSHRFASQAAQQQSLARTTGGDSVQKQAAAAHGLDLQVTRPAPDQLNVTWDRQLPPEAVRGELFIVDGSIRRLLSLDSAQLRQSKLTYFSTTSDISFRLDVLSASNAAIVSEYIRVLGTNTSRLPGPESGERSLRSSDFPRSKGSGEVRSPRMTAAVQPVVALPKASDVPVPAANPDAMPPLHNNQTEVTLAPPPEQQTPAVKTQSISESPVTKPPAAVPPQAPPQTTSGATSSANTAATVRQGQVSKVEVQQVPEVINVNPPQPLQRVMPHIHDFLPNGVPSARRVAVDVKIGPTGKVTAASTQEPFGLLSDACVTAAKQWRFSPALRNQQPVEGEYQIVFVFNPRR